MSSRHGSPCAREKRNAEVRVGYKDVRDDRKVVGGRTVNSIGHFTLVLPYPVKTLRRNAHSHTSVLQEKGRDPTNTFGEQPPPKTDGPGDSKTSLIEGKEEVLPTYVA